MLRLNYFTLPVLSLLLVQQAFADDKIVQYSGILLSVDLADMARDGDGVLRVRTGEKTVVVHLTSGESNCDRQAISIPSAKPGDVVKVSGVEESPGVLRVCSSGTYIK